ncbi:MAG: ABC transporter ATP-binding protein [Candidatus Lambdaproteobacteria bacterium]|nr:ABC transporter ATP-binding protein [Candidatus Lambdaproteobacteria bacterium]
MDRVRFLLSLLREHALSYLGGLLMLGLTLWMTVGIPRYLQEAIDLLSAEAGANSAAFLSRIGWVLGFAVAVVFTRTASRMAFYTPGRRVEFDLKNRMLAHLTRLQRGFFLENPSGAIISRINNDIGGVRMMLGFGLMQLCNSIGTLTLAPYYMYRISPWLTLFCALPIVVAFLALQAGLRRLRHEQLVQMKSMQDLSDFTVESYNGLNVLSAYRAFPWAEHTFATHSGAVRDSSIRMSNVRAYLMPVLMNIVNGMKVLLIFWGGLMVVRGEMTMGGLLAYALYLSMLVPPLMGLTFMLFMLQRGFTALVSLERIFKTVPDVPPVQPAAEAALGERLREGLRVSHLTFAYPDEPGHPRLRDVSLEVRPGEIVGIFGPIGSGKTTLVNVINRYLNPPPGRITLDGVDITAIGQGRLRRHVVTVTQEPFLFSDSIRDNIRFGSEADGEGPVLDTVHAAALEADLARFPAHLDTMVGEKGITLSGGQKQRISLARSMLKPCDVLILDDVLSAVDHETERFLVEQIYAFRHARSLLIVSHRLSVLERAQRIVVLDEGRVADVGTHDELIRRPGSYREAYLLQAEHGEADGTPAHAAGAWN